jgi:hypothetical protein
VEEKKAKKGVAGGALGTGPLCLPLLLLLQKAVAPIPKMGGEEGRGFDLERYKLVG